MRKRSRRNLTINERQIAENCLGEISSVKREPFSKAVSPRGISSGTRAQMNLQIKAAGSTIKLRNVRIIFIIRQMNVS